MVPRALLTTLTDSRDAQPARRRLALDFSPRFGETARMDKRVVAIAAGVAGVALVALAIVYFALPARSLPSFFPGHEAGSDRHHIKHGIAALLLGLAAFALAWFQSGPKSAN